MRVSLISTSIRVPKVLALYRKLGAEVAFYVAADEKTPLEAYEFCAGVHDCELYTPERQRELGYTCSELIGWSCVQRRNIALLEAVKYGAEVIYTVDDDNIPLDKYHWFNVHEPFDITNIMMRKAPFSGLKASSLSGWFDPGCLLVPQTKHRGFPISVKSEPIFESVVDANIGVAAGLCLGDPDIDAVTRIATAPIIHSVSELGRAGVVVDPACKTVFNSQNTSFRRELAPAMFMMPCVGRYDDIYASLVCQRVMRERDLHVHFGQPFIWQQRNQHNLLNDLRVELDGMDNIKTFASILDLIQLSAPTILGQVRHIYSTLQAAATTIIPPTACQAALAFCDDIEPLL